MSATITLPIELEGLLARKAAVEGVNVEQFALDTLRRVAEMPTISELFAEVGAAFEASGRTDEELQRDIEQALAEVRAERSDGTTPASEEPDPQGQAMLAVLARSAERLKDLPVSGETKDTLEMIRRARDGEMWGYESANQN